MLQRPRWRTIRRSRLFNRINASVSGLSVSRVANAVSQPKTRAPPNSVPAGFMTGTTSRESAESVGNEDITWNVVNRRLSTTEGFRFEWAVSPAERAASYPALAPDIRNNDHDVTANVSPQSDGPAQQTTPTPPPPPPQLIITHKVRTASFGPSPSVDTIPDFGLFI